MFNLLPKAEKDAIRREYRIRLVVVMLWFLFATLLVGSLLLLPGYFLSAQKEKAALRQFETLSKSIKAEESSNFDELLLGVKRRLTFLERKPPDLHLYELMARVAKARNEGISFESITVSRAEDKRRLDISGIAQNRSALVTFEKSLEAAGIFETVDFPVGNLAKDSNSEFTLTARGEF